MYLKMDKILKEANNIGEWENKVIGNLNYLYAYVEKELIKGYTMYNNNQLVEAFVLFMRVTKIYDLVTQNQHLILQTKRHLKLADNINEIINIIEIIKPKLIEKYGETSSSDKQISPNTKIMSEKLELRWNKFNS